MIHQRILPPHLERAATCLSDEAREALAFKELDEQLQRRAAMAHGVHVLRFPEDRTPLQRLAAWWHLRRHRLKPNPEVKAAESEITTEPTWTGHWATTKYL